MSAGAAGGAAAAAAARAMMIAEEEEMTPYSEHDLAEGWEFKILRANFQAFKNPERLQTILETEAQAGWTLVEKFDDSRVRLKRPASYKKLDAKLDFDPYRSYVGLSDNRLALFIVGGILAFFFIFTILMTALR